MELRPYQAQAVNAVWAWFRTNQEGNPLVVMPTGAGKSHVIAAIGKAVCHRGSDRKVLILAHRKELLAQNAEKLLKHWPEASVGVYSVGLGLRQLGRQVTIAGVQSIYRKSRELGPQVLVIIDECHLVDPTDDGTMYRMVLSDLQQLNPKMRVLGLSATPFRTSHGVITQGEGRIFTAVAFDVPVLELIRDSYLSPLVSKVPKHQADLSNVHVRCGEFVQKEMAEAFDRPGLMASAANELCKHGENRKSWLAFCSGVEHAEHVTDELCRRGIDAACVTGKTPPIVRDQVIREFKAGKIRALCNCEVLTTGFDHPAVDLIALLRATQSPGLFVQMVGRGFRVSEGKKNCLVLDFGGNLERHGPIDRIAIRRRRNPLSGKEEAEVEKYEGKICPSCEEFILAGEKECPVCGYIWPERRVELAAEPSEAPILSTDEPLRKREAITGMTYRRHTSKDPAKPDSMRVVYEQGPFYGGFSEWICIEHRSFAGTKAYMWWKDNTRFTDKPPPRTVEEALTRAPGEIKVPSHITVQKDGRYWRVVGRDYEVREKSESEKLFEETGFNI
jgi:DNA repair protein RadD